MFRNQIHYHSVWRDWLRDYGADLSLTVPLVAGNAPYDFDSDGQSDLAVFRAAKSNWYLNRTTAGFAVTNWGLASDQLAPADYDGDAKTDLAVFRDGVWDILQSSNSQPRHESFGVSSDTPVPTAFSV